MFGADAHIYDRETGHFVSQKHKDIATVINEWNPDVHLVWIPPKDRETEHDREYPFAVLHTPADREPYVIFHVRENEVDERIIARLWASDASKHDVLGAIEAEEAARQAVLLRRQIEEAEEAKEIAASIVRSPLNTYSHNGIKYKD